MADVSFSEIILASASPRRSFLLEQMGVRFRVLPAEVEEDLGGELSPEKMVLKNAQLKASWVAEREPRGLVLGSDTTVALGGAILNKPRDMEDAAEMLRRLSGQTHTVYTAVCLISSENDLLENHAVSSRVTFKSLDDAGIEEYFTIVNPLDKAGAYGIQQGQDLIIDSLDGSLNNVMGLPTEFLESLLDKLGLIEGLR